MEKVVLPLNNGVGIYEKGKLCVSTIDYQGEKRVDGAIVKENKKFLDKPFLRGFLYFFFGFYLYYKSFILQLDDKEEKNNSAKSAKKINFFSDYIMLIACIVASFLVGFLVFGILPSIIFNRLFDLTNYYFHSFMIALFRSAIFYVILFIT